MTLRQILTQRWLMALLLVPAVPLGAAAWTGLSAFSGPSPAPTPHPPALAVRIVRPQAVEGFSRARVFSGEVRARREVTLGFELTGRVSEVLADEGGRVARGQLLARLDSERAAARLAAASARLSAAEARLAEMLAGPRAQTLTAAAARVRALEEELELAGRIRGRRDALVASEVVSEEVRDDARTREQALTARLEASRAELDELQEGTREEVVAAQRATVAELHAALRQAELDLEDTRLVAPFDAIVVERAVDEGRVVSAGETVLRLIEDGPVEATVGVPLEVADRLEVGDALSLQGAGEMLPARVRGLLPELDGRARTVTVVLEVEARGRSRPVPGQVVRLELAAHEELAGLWVPTSALARGSRGLWVGYALGTADGAPAVVERRDLEVLHVEGERALVRGVLGASDLLVADGLDRVVPGQWVRPLED